MATKISSFRGIIIIIGFIYSYSCTSGVVYSSAYGSCVESDAENVGLDQMNAELLELNKINAQLEWESSTKASADIYNAKQTFYSLKIIWKSRWCDKLEKYQLERGSIIDCTNKHHARMIHLLCHRGPKYSIAEIKRFSSISDRLVQNYQMKKICRIHLDNTSLGEVEKSGNCYYGEHDVKRLMQTSRSEEERRWAWTSWRNNMGNFKNLFIQSVAIQNAGAKRNGYINMGACWRDEMDISNVEHLSNNLWESIKPLYDLLHAVVRFRLRKLHPDAITRATAPIPAHLIGDLWSLNWQTLADVLFPQLYFNLTHELIKKNYTVMNMMETSEDFFKSLQFPPMTNKLWMLSIIEKRNNSAGNYHSSATNMYDHNDFRILAWLKIDEEYLRIIYHEMGHVQYYMAYQHQPSIYQDGVNSAFHESIGDAIFLGAMTPQHLHRLGFMDYNDDNDDDDTISTDGLALLLKQALTKIPQIPYAFMMDKWRWRVFDGIVNNNEYNKAWWDLHRSLMGIVPPNSRQDSPELFDPAAKFHIITNTPYIRYFFSHILQFQIFERMCEVAVASRKRNYNKKLSLPLYKCDIYGAHAAGNELRKLMTLGSSIDTRQAFILLLNTTGYRVDSLLKYFQPIEIFLKQQIRINNIPVGWH